MLFQSFIKNDHGASTLRPLDTVGPLVELLFVLSGKLEGPIAGLGKISLSAGEYTLIYRPASFLPWPGPRRCDPDDPVDRKPNAGTRNMVTFTIGLPLERLQILTIAFPMLLPFLEKVKAGITCRLTHTPGMADLKMIAAIRNIMACCYREDIKNLYWDLQVSNLIILSLIGLGNNEGNGQINLKPVDIEKIEATRSYLVEHMEQPPTLIHLAHKMGMNDFKLKKAYKQLYGTTLFEDFLHARMEKAKSLLEETEQSIVAIAEIAGYKNVSSFSVAFKKYFGQTPGGYRRTS